MFPSSVGSGPVIVIPIEAHWNAVTFASMPISVGSVLAKEFELMPKKVRLDKRPNSVGIMPVRYDWAVENEVSAESVPISVGILPFTSQNDKLVQDDGELMQLK